MFTPYNITGLFPVNVNTPLVRIHCTDSLFSALRSTLIRFGGNILPSEWCEILLRSLFALGTVENFTSWGTETEVNCLNTSLISSLDKISDGITTSENSWSAICENLILLTRCSPSKDLLLEPLTTMFSSSHRLWAYLSTALKSDRGLPFDCYRRRHSEVRFDIHKPLEKRDCFLFYQIQTWRPSMTLFSYRYS